MPLNLGFLRDYALSERRFLFVCALGVILPLVAVAGYRALDPGKPRLPAPVVEPAPESNKPDKPAFAEFTDTFRKNETITEALVRHGLTKQQVFELVQVTRPVYALRKVIAGREFAGNLYANGDFHEFRYRVDDDRYLTVYRDGDTFVPLLKNFKYEVRTEPVTAVIDDSLYLAVTGSGEQPQLGVDLADIFAWDVDFYTDIQKGDSFRVLLEKKYLDGQFVRYGSILAVDLIVKNKRFSAFRFQNEYYEPGGKSLKKSLLKSPLQYTRISSRFSAARMHPILRIVRPHLGIDYAAPTGTPVVAVASGRVVSAGVDGGYGRSVRVRHNDGLESVYSHLSSIAVRAGTQVKQGELIGRVGSTGLATGPHLDFRLLERGKYINPTKKVLPAAPPVAASQFAHFAAQRDDLRRRLDLIPIGADLAQSAANAANGGRSWK